MSKRTEESEGAPIDQIWDHLNININKNGTGNALVGQ